MTVKEMHIGVDFLLQKINSNFIDTFLPQEIDWALNEEVIRFIKQRISPENGKYKGFESSQKRFDDLKSLIVSPLPLPLYLRDKDSVFTYLPSDYLTLINDRTNTKDLCGKSYTTVNTSNINKYIVPLIISNTSINLYATLKIRINNTQVFNITDYPPFSTGLSSLDSKFELMNLILKVLTDAGYDCKFNNYYDTIVNQAIIIVSDTLLTIEVEYSPSNIITINSIVKGYTKILPVINTSDSPNRLTSTEYLYNLLDSSFGNTIVSNPLSTLENDRLIIFHKQKFIASTVNISYIRKPRKISLSLNQDCDLDEWIQLEIVDNTSKRLAGLIGNPLYKEIINENKDKE